MPFLGYIFLEEEGGDDRVSSNCKVNYVESIYSSSKTLDSGGVDSTQDIQIGKDKIENCWDYMVNQCQNQFNVKTSEKELCDSVNEEVRENLNFYCKKTKLTTDAITECINNISKRPISQLQLDNVSLALSSIFNCKVLYLGKLGDIVRVIDVAVLSRSSGTVEQVMSVWISSVVEDLPSLIQRRIPTNPQ